MITANLQIDLIRGRFLKLNKERIERTQALMPSSQRDLLDLLPLLFHLNIPELPGFIDEQTPSGVFSYILDDKLYEAAQRHWGTFDSQKRGMWSYDVEAIFLMGSCGTIAFNRKSDFDIWLCYRPELNDDALAQLTKKAERIERWFDSIGMEIHFFLMNAIGFKNGNVITLSPESSGTAQHHILLDEFYRSSIWLAGKTPFWWYVPPENEASYDELHDELNKNKIISKKETIDFGSLPNIPTSEFFGAAVWQIYKGIDSPYKSILKITLMESYAGSFPKTTPLSAEFKQNIYDGIEDFEALDPYLGMLRRIETHLVNISESNRLEVIRRSFYLKLNISLSHTGDKNSWRRKLIEKLVASWSWAPDNIEHLDNQKNWRLEEVSTERKMLLRNLTKSYTYLSNFARKNAKKSLINQKDLSILGRKLYSVFERKSGKIEIFNRGIVDNIREGSITIMLLHGSDGRDNWRLYRGRVTGNQFKKLKALKQTYSLIELSVWMHFNQLISDTTQKLLYAPGSDINVTEFNALLEKLENFSASEDGENTKKIAFSKTPVVKKNTVFMNIGKPPNIVGNKVDKQLVSGDVDVLNYGARTECLLQTIEYCYINTWKEIFVFKYYGTEGLARFLCDLLIQYLAASKQQSESLRVMPEIHSFGSHISHVLSTRLSSLIKAILRNGLSSPEGSYFVYEAGKKLYCIKNDEKKFDFEHFESTTLLVDYLSQSIGQYRTVAFDDLAVKSHAIKSVFARNKKNHIQLFLLKTQTNIVIYILDELGVLFYQKMPIDKTDIIAQHFMNFIKTIVEKNHFREAQLLDTTSILGSSMENTQFETYKLTKDQYRYRTKLLALPEEPISSSYGVQVIGEVVDKKTVFKFYCDDTEYSTAESGNQIFRVVAEHILKQRQGRQKYYVYITDLELSPALLEGKYAHSFQVVKHLQYKKKIERKLNKVLAGL